MKDMKTLDVQQQDYMCIRPIHVLELLPMGRFSVIVVAKFARKGPEESDCYVCMC